MEGHDERKSSSDESRSENTPVADVVGQQSMLEKEIKKIISDLDVKFESSHDEDDGKTSVSGLENSSTRMTRDTPRSRLESVSTMSNAATVVHQRVPARISVAHVGSERRDWPPAQSYRPPSPRQEGSTCEGGHYGAPEHAFYQPEKDEITEPTITDTVNTSTVNTSSTSYAQSSSQVPVRPSQNRFMPPVPEEQDLRNFRNGADGDEHQYQREPCAIMPEYNGTHQPHHQCEHQVEPTRFQQSYGGVEYGQHYFPQNVCSHPYNTQEPYHIMKENTNRYNHSHMMYSAVKEPEKTGQRRSFTDYIVSKSRSFFSRRDDSDSGEVIPQLYKACVKNGTCPPRFTFKAVTGLQPPYLGETAPPHVSATNLQTFPAVPSYDQMNYNSHPFNEQVKTCGCSQEPPKKLQPHNNQSCGKSGEIVTMPSTKNGIKTKAFYGDSGCGYISQGSVPEKVDIYCFDQLNTGFFRTSDHPPPLFADIAVQRTEKYATVFWAEIYGVVNICTAFIIALLLQTFKFLLQGIVRPLMIGSVQILADYFIKPLLTLMYNGFTQPISIFFYNVIASIRDVLQPLAKGISYFFEPIAVVLKSIRIVEVRNVTNITPCSPQAVKYC